MKYRRHGLAAGSLYADMLGNPASQLLGAVGLHKASWPLLLALTCRTQSGINGCCYCHQRELRSAAASACEPTTAISAAPHNTPGY
jgi:hypothetical protein